MRFYFYFLLIGCIALTGGLPAQSQAQAEKEDPYRVGVIFFSHETCTFCPGGETTVEDWTRIRPPFEGDEVFEASSSTRGFVDRTREYGGVELVGIKSPAYVYGAQSNSWIAKSAFEEFMGMILDDLEEKKPLDGIMLSLHGGMAVRGIPRPEAEIAKRVRKAVGPDVPIVGTFDLHGNEDEEFLKWADMSFVMKRFPHYDGYRQGERAARMLLLTMRGNYTPTTATRRPGIITATVYGWTGRHPVMDIYERARRWEVRENDAYVNVFLGFPWADVPDAGATIQVITNGNQALADSIADDMNDYMWRVRKEFAGQTFPKPKEAVQSARQDLSADETPIVLADYSDRSGDATWILRQLVDQGVDNFLYGTLRDERAIKKLEERGAEPGDSFSMKVGGFTGEASGDPVQIEGTLVYFGPKDDYERVAAVEFGNNNLLILTPTYEQVIRPGWFRFGGINPDDYDLFVVKSRAHFRRGFDQTGYAESIYIVGAPGPFLGTRHLDALEYENLDLSKLYPFGTPPERR